MTDEPREGRDQREIVIALTPRQLGMAAILIVLLVWRRRRRRRA